MRRSKGIIDKKAIAGQHETMWRKAPFMVMHVSSNRAGVNTSADLSKEQRIAARMTSIVIAKPSDEISTLNISLCITVCALAYLLALQKLCSIQTECAVSNTDNPMNECCVN
ncbi:hypothetical protein BB561_000060 [Smittium simulii]|uniref:Uncharacterized protein n=1 Tax=Smittium simulii TaxID=133385 RepID=A0A2T9Z102_9FUNG|nr:hypothetical protein BB561_000060 [Smittium simulii]